MNKIPATGFHRDFITKRLNKFNLNICPPRSANVCVPNILDLDIFMTTFPREHVLHDRDSSVLVSFDLSILNK